MMNETKTSILLKKAKKLFEQYPNKTSAIIKMKIGNVLTHWNVEKRNNQYHITEINSSKNKMIIDEAENDVTKVGKPKHPFEYDPNQKPGESPKGGFEPIPSSRIKAAGQAKQTANKKPGFFKQLFTKPTTADDYLNKHRNPSLLAKTLGKKPDPLTPPEPSTMNRSSADVSTNRMTKWKFDSPVGDFAKTLSQTKNLGSTLNTAYDDLTKHFGGEQGAKNAINGYLTPLGQKINSKADLNNPNLQKKLGSYLSKLNPNLKKAIPGLPSESKNRKTSVIKEASPAFSKISSAFMMYLSNPGDHVAQSNFINTISREKPTIQNKQEKDSIEKIESEYLGKATSAADMSTKQTPLGGFQKKQQTLNMGIERKYRIVLSEAGNDGFQGALDEPEDTQQQPDPVQQNPEQQGPMQPQKTAEEKAISKLAGQTIKSASVDVDEGIVRLSLNLAGSNIPASFIVEKNGKVIFSFKGQKFVIKK